MDHSAVNILDNANGMNKNAHTCHCSTNTINTLLIHF